MRKIGYLLCLLLGVPGATQAEPYRHLDDVAAQPRTFLAHRLLTADTLRYCLTMYPYKNPFVTPQQMDTFIRAALREWTHGIALRIRQAGREEEFNDLLDVLEKPLELAPVNGCTELTFSQDTVSARDTTADIVFLVSARRCAQLRKKETSFYSPAKPGQVPFICLQEVTLENPLRSLSPGEYFPATTPGKEQKIIQNRQKIFEQAAAGNYPPATQQALWETDRFFSYDGPTLFSTVLHELGHAFGLGDEYLPERPAAYASRQPGQGIMHNRYSHITCDETDGMITLLDRLSGIRRTFQSFCENRGQITNGTEN